jgi:hypothetical protein
MTGTIDDPVILDEIADAMERPAGFRSVANRA